MVDFDHFQNFHHHSLPWYSSEEPGHFFINKSSELCMPLTWPNSLESLFYSYQGLLGLTVRAVHLRGCGHGQLSVSSSLEEVRERTDDTSCCGSFRCGRRSLLVLKFFSTAKTMRAKGPAWTSSWDTAMSPPAVSCERDSGELWGLTKSGSVYNNSASDKFKLTFT